MISRRLMSEIAASPTVIDRVVQYFSPRAGLERLKARTMMAAAGGGYQGGRRDRRNTRTWRPPEASADADILPDLPDLRARSRDLARNMPIATGAIATKVTNVVGDGLQLQAALDADILGIGEAEADAMEREQEREWALFSRSADFTRVQHLDELAALVFRSASESGDVFAIRRFRLDPGDRYGTKVQIIEADRVGNPGRRADTETIAGGVEVDAHGVPVAYHVADRHPGNLRTTALQWQRVAGRTDDGKRVVLHLYDRLRPEQTRGVPYLAPVIEHLKNLSGYSESEVTAALISAMYTVFITSPADESGGSPIAGERDSSLAANEVKLGRGAVVSLDPGEKAEFANPTRPNAQYDPFVQALCREIGVALELPYELLIKHFTASYSASRAALEMAWQFFRKCRSWLARNFYQQLYEWMMEEAVASGRLVRPGFFENDVIRQAYLGAEWIGPSRASLNPKQEAEADALDIETGTKTREQVCMERTGGRFEKKHAQLAKEAALRRQDGLGQARPPSTTPDQVEDADVDSDDDDEPATRARRTGEFR